MNAGQSPTVLITARNLQGDRSTRALIAASGFHAVESIGASSSAARSAAADSVAAMIVGSETIDANVMTQYPNLRYILRTGAGLDNIAVSEARIRGIEVANLPGLNTESVADYTFGLALCLSRNIVAADAQVRSGEWNPLRGSDLHQKTIGIIGFGRIGQAVAIRAAGFGMRILVARRDHATEPAGADADEHRSAPTTVTMSALLTDSDFVTLHLPLNKTTEKIIGAAQLQLMKTSACLVNTARGELVDQPALLAALREGTIAGAALDVFANEPHIAAEFTKLGNVLLSPHTASFGDTTMRQLGSRVCESLTKFFETESVPK